MSKGLNTYETPILSVSDLRLNNLKLTYENIFKLIQQKANHTHA